jgi:hypothetical protein
MSAFGACDAMSLLLVFIACLLVGQSLSIFTGLVVERYFSEYTSLLTFIVCFFLMFGVTWKVAVWLTEPGHRLGAWLGSGAESAGAER